MRKIIFILVSLLMIIPSSISAQQSSNSVLWPVFSSGPFDFETFEVGEAHQDFISVRQVGNVYYWGDLNIFTVYNKREKHSGFHTFNIYDFIDKYNQRGTFIYILNRSGNIAKHMFCIQYEGIVMGKYYISNDPENK